MALVPISFVTERGGCACEGMVSYHGPDDVRYDGLIWPCRLDLSVYGSAP